MKPVRKRALFLCAAAGLLALAAAGAPRPGTTVYALEHIRLTAVEERGPWKEGPTAVDGTVPQNITDSFPVDTDRALNISADDVGEAFRDQTGMELADGQTRSLSGGCTVTVPQGGAVTIYYRAKYGVYTAEEVAYQTGIGRAKREVSRKPVTVYVPRALSLRW